MNLSVVLEYALKDAHRNAIISLFQHAFEGYPEHATYYNQVPDFRVLAWQKNNLVGHAGIHHRNISIGKQCVSSVFGIADLCVAPDHQKNNVGTVILDHVASLANKSNVDFLILTSGEDKFYMKNGFSIVHNPCRWLVIHNHESMGVLRRQLQKGLLIRPTGTLDWPEGEVDFMGHMF